MKKLIAGIIVCLSILLFGILSMLFLIDYNSVYKNYFNNLALRSNAKEITNFQIGKFPVPYLIIDHLQLENGISLYDIEVSFTLKSLIQLRPQIKLLKIGKVKVEQDKTTVASMSYQALLETVLNNKLNLQVSLYISNLNIFDKYNNLVLELKNFSSTYDNNLVFNTDMVGTGKLSGSIENTREEGSKFGINVECPYYNFQFSGLYKNSQLLNGKGKYQVKNLARVISSSFPEMQSIFNNLTSNELINIDFDLSTAQNQMQLKNLLVSANSIVGQGEYNITTNTFLLNFSKINLDKLFANDNTTNLSINELSKSPDTLLFINKSLKADINIGALTFAGDEYNNVKFISNPDNEKLYIKDFSGKSANGEFKASGVISQNAYRSIFDGKVYLKHKDLNSILKSIGYEKAVVQRATPVMFESDIKSTLINLSMSNVLLKIDNVNVDGNISFKFIGSNPRIDSRINVSSVNLGDSEYPVISQVWNFITGLVTGMKDNDYLDKFIAIRTLPYVGSFDITLNDLFIDKASLGKVSLFANLSPENIKIDNLYINNGNEYIILNLHLMANMLNPTFKIKINDGSLHVNFLAPKSLLDLRNEILTNFDLSKVAVQLNCSLSKVIQNDLVINNLKFSAENDSTLIKISDINANILSGNLQGSGSILLDPYTINFVYAFNSFDLQSLAKLLPSGFLNTSGSASINGMFTTNGDSMEKQLYNLYIRSSLLAKDITINNFSLDDFIKTVVDKDYDVKNFEDDLKSALLTGTTAVSNLSSDIMLVKGMLSLGNMKLQTKYAVGAADANINIYNFGIDLSSVFSFYILNTSPVNKRYNRFVKNSNYDPMNIKLKVDGNLFLPQKIADSKELLQYLKLRVNDTSKTDSQ